MEAENIKSKSAPKDRKLSPSPIGNRVESAKFVVLRMMCYQPRGCLTKNPHISGEISMRGLCG